MLKATGRNCLYFFALLWAVFISLAFPGMQTYAGAKDVKNKYHMVRDLTNLSEKQKVSTTKWKDEIIKLAEKHPDDIILNGTSGKKRVALTFDDGPDAKITPKILDCLIKNNVKATFFFQGGNIKNNEAVVKKAYNNGMQIAGHSYSHPQFTKTDSSKIQEEMKKTNDLFKKTINKTPAYFRPPYGDIDENTLKLLSDYKIIIWSVDPMDWAAKAKAADIANYVINNVQPDDIVLMHSSSGRNETLKALPLIIQGLKDKGYSFSTVSDIVGTNSYKD